MTPGAWFFTDLRYLYTNSSGTISAINIFLFSFAPLKILSALYVYTLTLKLTIFMIFDKMCNFCTEIVNFVNRCFRNFHGNYGCYRKKMLYMISSLYSALSAPYIIFFQCTACLAVKYEPRASIFYRFATFNHKYLRKYLGYQKYFLNLLLWIYSHLYMSTLFSKLNYVYVIGQNMKNGQHLAAILDFAKVTPYVGTKNIFLVICCLDMIFGRIWAGTRQYLRKHPPYNRPLISEQVG